MRRLFIFFYSLFVLSAWAQAQVTTEGRDFWLGFMENADSGSPSSLELFLTSKDTAQVSIEVFWSSQTINLTVIPGTSVKRVISFATNNPFANSASGIIQNKAIHVISDVDISVYAFNKRFRSADASVVLPTNSLGKEYFVMAHWDRDPSEGVGGDQNSPSQLLVVATEDDTKIEISPSVETLDNKPANTPFEITLNQGESYQIQAFADLTGTYIKSIDDGSGACKNIAVFGGNKWGRVTQMDCSIDIRGANGTSRNEGFAQDHLFEQMYPVETFGTEFSLVPFELRNNYVVKLLAAEDNTSISISGIQRNLERGEWVTLLLMDATFIESNKPIQVAQFSQTMSCDAPNTTFSNIRGVVTPALPGDPFMIMVSPNQQRLKEITFNTLQSDVIDRYFVNLITDDSGINRMFLDGSLIENSNFSQIGSSNMYSASIELLGSQDYNVSNTEGFIAYVYAFGVIESFGYVAGASLENLNLQIQGEDEFIGNIAQNACLNAAIDFDARFETPAGEQPRFNTFEWDFGDGTVAQGQQLTHSYANAGTYEVTLVASDGQGSCGTSETVLRTIEVKDTQTNGILGPPSVCPDVVGVKYSISGEPGNNYEWFIAGGNITTSRTAESILVDWADARDDAFIKVLPTNPLGCVGDTLTLPVVINKRLQPATPQSNGFTDDEVCFTDLETVTYFTPPTNGSSYEWFIDTTKGEILGSNDSDQINVRWFGPGTGSVWYREFNPNISDCEGFSDKLQVTIYSEIVSVPEIKNVLCHGEANGEISLSLSGGKPGNYQVQWDNGMRGPVISGLIAGDYVATITDALGCEIIETYTVTEPNELLIEDVGVLPVRCFQESNGSASLVVSGGTTNDQGQYDFSWVSDTGTQQSNNNMNGTLAAGDYTVVVTDANGCQAQASFTINEPPLLEPDLESLINEPICPQATDGTAFIDAKGGTPDYQFFWDNNPTTDSRTGTGLSRGFYTVRIEDANGCETFLDIEVTERFPKIFIPTAFSPNDDGENDVFKPVADCALAFSMQIVNRWGSIIFSTENINNGWDGTFQGEAAPNGNYSYVIFYAGSINDVTFEETYRGSFKLIR